MTKEEKQAYNREYHKRRYAKDRDRICARVKAYAEQNKDTVRAGQKKYREANKERLSAVSKAYYQAHREERIAYQKALHAAKADAVKAYKKKLWQSRRDEFRKAQREYYWSNRDRIRDEFKRTYATSPERFKEYSARRRALKRATEIEPVDLKKILEQSHGICGICRKPLDLFGIDFDHIVPLSRGGTHTTDNIQATHAFCNRSKGAKVG